VRRLERPDALAQPLEERQIVRAPAKERLAKVHVRLDEAGDHRASRSVDDPNETARTQVFADVLDHAIGQEQITDEDSVRSIACDDVAPANERLHAGASSGR
jgi:hypothetical protein